jgi:antirestriction protein ArdC
MTKDKFMGTFIVRLPIPKSTTRLEAESMLRDHLLESGMWQGDKDVYVRESMHLTPEMEVHRAEEARRRFSAENAAKAAQAELRLQKTPEMLELQRLQAIEKAADTEARLIKKAAARAAKAERAIRYKQEHKQQLATHDAKMAKRAALQKAKNA